MSFLSSESLKKILPKLISSSDSKNIKRGAYELTLGPEVYISGDKVKKFLEIGKQTAIPPGQFALLLTEEIVTIPADMIGFISIKADKKFRGLVNVSGFHVDPGFRGRLKFSVYNAGSGDIVLTRGELIFLIWFSKLDQKTNDLYDGKKYDQMEISSEDVMRMAGEVASPAALNKRLIKVEETIDFIKKFFWFGVLVFAVTVLAEILVNSITSSKSSRPNTPSITLPIATPFTKQITNSSK